MLAETMPKAMGAAWLAIALMLGGFGCSMEPTEDEVRVEIQEKISDTEKDKYVDLLKKLIDGGSNMTKTSSMNGQVTIVVGPVSDVEAFAEKIKFGKVVEVKEAERTIVISVKG